ncbi:MAG: S-layer homology domain-containing protein [Oscillospiraceae bacterium]
MPSAVGRSSRSASARSRGLLNGRGSNFAPQANATRAEACVVLCRLQKYVDAQSAQPAAAEPAALAG